MLAFAGRLEAHAIGAMWRPAIHAAQHARGHSLSFDLRNVTFCDVGGASLLAAVETAYGAPVEAVGLAARAVGLLERARAAGKIEQRTTSITPFTLRDVAAAAARLLAFSVTFLGEAAVSFVELPRHRRMLRVRDLLGYVDSAGIRSLPLVVLLGYLIGLILAFQSAVPMRQFGADIFVASLVAIALLRELGPLLAAVILAGRTGVRVRRRDRHDEGERGDRRTDDDGPRSGDDAGAAADDRGDVRDAGDDDGAGHRGAAGHGDGDARVRLSVRGDRAPGAGVGGAGDLYGGLFKSICFGLVVSAIGCRAGLGTGVGPRSVGLSATSAVVGGIVATIAVDGVFALVFYRLRSVSEAPIIEVDHVAQRFGGRYDLPRRVTTGISDARCSSSWAGRGAASQR